MLTTKIINGNSLISDLLKLPEWVFPVAGLCVGYPSEPGIITSRLGLDVTVHTDSFDESDIAGKIDAYDRRRHARQQYKKQRDVARFGTADLYGWSEDKARQYAKPERADFGAFIRGKKFNLS